MRKPFEPQLTLGQIPIARVVLPGKSRDELPPILEGLRWIFVTPEVRQPILDLLVKKVVGQKKATGRPGLELWQILVLGVVRLGLDCDYDRLEDLANHHVLIRSMMGLAPEWGAPGKRFHHRTLSDNVTLLDEHLLQKINAIVAAHGRKAFSIKPKDQPLQVKVDSYVLETDVHFPTDVNLLWDAMRKCLDYVVSLCQSHGMAGWRKEEDWRARLKSDMRAVSRTNQSGGAHKEDRMLKQVHAYLADARQFEVKVFDSWRHLRDQPLSLEETVQLALLSYFHDELIRHLDLVERRLILGETIPHAEKRFSLFESHTEWVNKGKLFPPVELGHKLQIATEQHGLIVDYAIAENITEGAALLPAVDRMLYRFGSIQSLSTDKGFSSQENRELLELYIPQVIMPQRGRLNQEQQQREQARSFRALRHQHSAVESDINCLEHHGLNRCLDKGREGYGRYVGLGVLSYNLHKIGAHRLKMRAAQSKELQAA